MLKRRHKGFDYKARNHKDFIRRAPSEDEVATKGEWVHKGGGYYENSASGEVSRGNPDA